MSVIWKLRNLLKKSFTFWQNHFSSIIDCGLHDIFLANKIEESHKHIEITPAFDSDLIFASLTTFNYNKIKPGGRPMELQKIFLNYKCL